MGSLIHSVGVQGSHFHLRMTLASAQVLLLALFPGIIPDGAWGTILGAVDGTQVWCM